MLRHALTAVLIFALRIAANQAVTANLPPASLPSTLATSPSAVPPAASTFGLTPRATQPAQGGSTRLCIKPHGQYSSSRGVIGCKIDVRYVAYFPEGQPTCENYCIKLTSPTTQRSVYLLWVDQSGGSHDISYHAWNELITGVGPEEDLRYGSGILVDFEHVAADNCAHLIKTDSKKLPLLAGNADMAVLTDEPACLQNWSRFDLYNYLDTQCSLEATGELCSMPPSDGGSVADCISHPKLTTSPATPVKDFVLPANIDPSQGINECSE